MRLTLKWAPERKKFVLMWSGGACFVVAGALLVAATMGLSQNPSTTAPSTPPRSPTLLSPEANRPPNANDQMLMREARTRKMNFDAANTERMRQMAQAAEMLETLAISLKVQIDNDQSGKVSEEELRKAENIAKLAHIVQDRMKLTVAPN